MEGELALFGGRLTAADGSTIAVVGLCWRERLEVCKEKLQLLRHLRFDGVDFIGIDRRLADCLTRTFAKDALTVGATVRVSNGEYPCTGGVLGSPNMEVASAERALEPIAEHLWLYTQPGGPGFVVQSARSNAEALASRVSEDRRGVNWLMTELSCRRISCALAIWDGSGVGSCGTALGIQGKTILLYNV